MTSVTIISQPHAHPPTLLPIHPFFIHLSVHSSDHLFNQMTLTEPQSVADTVLCPILFGSVLQVFMKHQW